MYMQQDWLMRQIVVMTRYIASLLFGGRHILYELPDKAEYNECDALYADLLEKLRAQDFCAAEDMLFEALDTQNNEYLAMGLAFYERLNEFSDEELETHNFSRVEIESGVRELAARFGLPLLD